MPRVSTRRRRHKKTRNRRRAASKYQQGGMSCGDAYRLKAVLDQHKLRMTRTQKSKYLSCKHLFARNKYDRVKPAKWRRMSLADKKAFKKNFSEDAYRIIEKDYLSKPDRTRETLNTRARTNATPKQREVFDYSTRKDKSKKMQDDDDRVRRETEIRINAARNYLRNSHLPYRFVPSTVVIEEHHD